MKILIKQAKIVDASSSQNGKVMDLLIEDGIIMSIDKAIEDSDAHIIEVKNLHVAVGWADIKSIFVIRDTNTETINSGLDAAAFGGFTHVGLLPSTDPVIDNKSGVQYLYSQADNHVTEVCQLAPLQKV